MGRRDGPPHGTGSALRRETLGHGVGHAAQHGGVGTGTGRVIDADRVELTDAERVAEDRGEDRGVELRLGEDAGDILFRDERTQIGKPGGTGLGRVADRHGTGGGHAEAGLEILVGVVKDQKGAIGEGCQINGDLVGKGGQFGLCGLGVGGIEVGIAGVDRRQVAGDEPEPGDGVGRIEPCVGVGTGMGVIMGVVAVACVIVVLVVVVAVASVVVVFGLVVVMACVIVVFVIVVVVACVVVVFVIVVVMACVIVVFVIVVVVIVVRMRGLVVVVACVIVAMVMGGEAGIDAARQHEGFRR